MKGDLSRDTFDRARHYSAVRLQQGRVVTDADWNEQADLTRYRAERAGTRHDRRRAARRWTRRATRSSPRPTRSRCTRSTPTSRGSPPRTACCSRTTNGGADWTLVDLARPRTCARSPTVGGTGWAVGDGGVVRKTINRARRWIAQDAGTLATLRGVAVFDADHAWAVGDGGVVVATSDGGATWTPGADRRGAPATRCASSTSHRSRGRAAAARSSPRPTAARPGAASRAARPRHLRALACFGTTLRVGGRATAARSCAAPTAARRGCRATRRRDGDALRDCLPRRERRLGRRRRRRAAAHAPTAAPTGRSRTPAPQRPCAGCRSSAASPAGWSATRRRRCASAAARPTRSTSLLPAVNLSIEPGPLLRRRHAVRARSARARTRTSPTAARARGSRRAATSSTSMPGSATSRRSRRRRSARSRSAGPTPRRAPARSRRCGRCRCRRQPVRLELQLDDRRRGTRSSTRRGRVLAARAEPQLAPASLCEIAATAGYRRLENQLYRVEVHDGRREPDVQVVARERLGRLCSRERQRRQRAAADDRARSPRAAATPTSTSRCTTASSWSTTTPSSSVAPAQLFEYLNDGNDELELVLAGVPVGHARPGSGAPPDPAPLGSPADRAGDNVLPIVEGTWIELEEGVQVRFAPGGTYRPGDYWQIPARTITADVEWPRNDDGDPLARPPAGIADAYCRLGIVEVGADGSITVVADCRKLFPPLTAIDAAALRVGRRPGRGAERAAAAAARRARRARHRAGRRSRHSLRDRERRRHARRRRRRRSTP